MPPPTTISTPVTYELPEARNGATFATSSGRQETTQQRLAKHMEPCPFRIIIQLSRVTSVRSIASPRFVVPLLSPSIPPERRGRDVPSMRLTHMQDTTDPLT